MKTKQKRLSKDFCLEEFERSETAKRIGIRNIAPAKARKNLAHLCTHVLQPLRDALKSPLTISSGYRSAALNRAVGGVCNSQHRLGEAADIFCSQPHKWVEILLKNNIPFDQVILYPHRHFIHISYKHHGPNRKEILHK